MKSLVVTILLFCLMVGGVVWNYRHINRVSDELQAQISALPDTPDEACVAAVEKLRSYWEACVDSVEFSAGFTAVDRIGEQLATLHACAKCGDLYGYRTARALLADAVEDLRRPELLSLGTML